MKKRKIRKLIVRSMAIPQWSDSIPHPSEPQPEKKITITNSKSLTQCNIKT
jgi:hypothetical protein